MWPPPLSLVHHGMEWGPYCKGMVTVTGSKDPSGNQQRINHQAVVPYPKAMWVITAPVTVHPSGVGGGAPDVSKTHVALSKSTSTPNPEEETLCQ